MPAPSPLPKYVYKILPEAPPQPLPTNLPLSELDAKDGFIHLSTAKQIPSTVDRFFAETHVIWLLKIELDRIEKDVKWEDAGSGCFAHIYGPMPGNREVTHVKEFRRVEGDIWVSMLERDDWLV